eukprot:7982930-Alexandrium_andersonii.AAC.1
MHCAKCALSAQSQEARDALRESCGQAHPGFCRTSHAAAACDVEAIAGALGKLTSAAVEATRWSRLLLFTLPAGGRRKALSVVAQVAGGKLRPAVQVYAGVEVPGAEGVEGFENENNVRVYSKT